MTLHTSGTDFSTLPNATNFTKAVQDGDWEIGAYVYVTTVLSPADLNQDGRTDIQDIQLCVNVILETQTDPDIVARADVNKDGSVNTLDIQEIVNVILG